MLESSRLIVRNCRLQKNEPRSMSVSMLRIPVCYPTLLLIIVASHGCSDSSQMSDLDNRRQRIKEQESKFSEESQTRRARSISILKSQKVPFIDHLPVILTEEESTRRTTEQVAQRAIALCIVAAKGEGLEQEMIDQLVKEYQLASVFTPKESEFIRNPKPTQHDRVQFTWRYECCWVMLWALGFVDELKPPNSICDVVAAVTIVRDNGRKGFLEKAELRSQAEILDAADLIYRYHWAVRDAQINNRETTVNLDSGVVLERHYALNWLIGYMDQEWDDVTTDT